MKILFSILILIAMIISGCKLIHVDLFDSNNAKIELFNKIINNPEAMDSIIKCSKFYHHEIGKYFFENPSVSLLKFLKQNKGNNGSLLYNKKFTMTRYPIKHVYENGIDIYIHEISFIFEDGESDLLEGGGSVIKIGFEFLNSKWYFKGLSVWTKDGMYRRYKNLKSI